MIGKPETTPQDIVDSLSVDYGYERSVKLVQGELLSDRYLLSVHKDAFGHDPVVALSRVLQQLNAPVDCLARIESELLEADVVHFGYERQAGRLIYKVYLEYASKFRDFLAAGEFSEPQLVHVAYKWDPVNSPRSVKTYYSCKPPQTAQDLVHEIQSAYQGGESRSPCQTATAILEQALQKTDYRDLMVMKVYEDNNPRSSYDLNLYNAEMPVSDTLSLLSGVAEYFSIPGQQWSDFMRTATEQQLGHISGGIGRDGEDFFTIYFGVVGRSGKGDGH